MFFSARGILLPYKDITTRKASKWLLSQDDIVLLTMLAPKDIFPHSEAEGPKNLKKFFYEYFFRV